MNLYDKMNLSLNKHFEPHKEESVKWTAFHKEGYESGKWSYSACYSPIMKNLGSYEIHCIPFLYPKPKVLRVMQPLNYLKFMRICQNEGLIPPEVRFFYNAKVGNCMIVPQLGWGRHTVYITLSLYRFTDCRPKDMTAALLLFRETKLPWLQVLHYILGKMSQSIGSGHVFINMSHSTYGNMAGLNPGIGMALRAFCNMSPEEHLMLEPQDNTCSMFNSMSKEVNPLTNSDFIPKPKWGSSNRPRCLYTDQEDILNPKYSPIYSDDSLGAEDLLRIMQT